MEPEFFFVLGLPRSRTAWLANWLTTDCSLCMHDAWRFANTAPELRQFLRSRDFSPTATRYIGSSDSSNGWRYDELKAEFPKAKFALIERPAEDVLVSALDLGCAPEPTQLVKILNDLDIAHQRVKDTSIFVTAFDSLNDASVVRALQKHLMPTRPFNQARFALLDSLKVVIHEAKYFNKEVLCKP